MRALRLRVEPGLLAFEGEYRRTGELPGRPAGHDPVSASLKGWCSAHLNYGPVIGGERVESNALPVGSRVTAGLGDHPNLLTLSVESGWQGRTRTDIRLINSELAYRMAHLPILVRVVGFEPTPSRFQGEDSDQAELLPEKVVDRG